MKPDDFTKTLEMAILHGGHFHRKLAEAGLAADPINKAKIFRTFPDLVLNLALKVHSLLKLMAKETFLRWSNDRPYSRP